MGLVGRREFLTASGALFAATLARSQGTYPPRIGFLGIGSRRDGAAFLEAFRAGLASKGRREGATIVVDVRYANGEISRFAALAAELVHESKADVLVIPTCGNPYIEVVRRASRTIPLVVASCGDIPGFMGDVASFAKPGGNTTGQTTFAPDLAAKRLEILKELVPDLTTAAVLWNSTAEAWEPYWMALRRAATALGVTLQSVEVRSERDLDAAFAAVTRDGAGAILTLVDPLLWVARRRIIEFAGRQRVPAAYDLERFADDGGLLAYGPDLVTAFRAAAAQVDRILKGERPGDIPVERPNSFRLVVNLKTAQALGLALPTTLLLRADRVIE
jgi:putative ABC transport system substrate-binding protein